jgi:1-deoxy-D-xylulose-5-phosphate reductoisomerase
VLNGANEIAVEAFLAGKIGYLQIVEFVEKVLEEHLVTNFVSDLDLTIEEVLTAARWAESKCRTLVTSVE